jgi:hypothetical protein
MLFNNYREEILSILINKNTCEVPIQQIKSVKGSYKTVNGKTSATKAKHGHKLNFVFLY